MARKLILLWLLLTSLAQAKTCPGCDCPSDDCYTPCCDCTLPVSRAWSETTLQRIRARLGGALGERIQVKRSLSIRLVEPDRLLKFGDGDGVQGLYDDGQITLSSILTRRQAVAVLAHEYGHAWQDENHRGYDQVDNSLREGFAEWVALQALKRFGFGSGGDLLRSNRDPVYGGGLRWFLQVEGNFGREAVFEQATRWLDVNGGRLPPPPPPKEPKKPKPERNPDDESVPDDLPQSGDGPKSR